MRGTLQLTSDEKEERGIIPAYAGNTTRLPMPTPAARDHPRVCGEHFHSQALLSPVVGSSPRMRGTLRLLFPDPAGTGIIPAYAGNTCRSSARRSSQRDHPRVCGEHLIFRAACEGRMGSSPRMRGTPITYRHYDRPDGIIPAYAGNTLGLRGCFRGLRDHPRVCGEHYLPSTPLFNTVGSSPRMRGTPTAHPLGFVVDGIIPAYAGNTPRPWELAAASWDHPRVCGEHAYEAGVYDLAEGSSPRMRGTR